MGHSREDGALDRHVIEFVRRAQGEPVSIGEIAESLGYARHQAPELRVVVKRLVREGRLESARGAGLRIPEGDGHARPHGRRSHGSPEEATPHGPHGRRRKPWEWEEPPARDRGGRRAEGGDSPRSPRSSNAHADRHARRGRDASAGGAGSARDPRGRAPSRGEDARRERDVRNAGDSRDRRGARGGAHDAGAPRATRGGTRRVVEGRVALNKRGFGFVADSEGPGEDLYLSPAELAGVMDGDEIRAEVHPGRDGRTMGRLLAVLSRARRRVVGTYHEDRRGVGEVVPDGATTRQRLVIDERGAQRGRFAGRAPRSASDLAPSDGDVVEVEILEYPTRFRPGLARVVEILGDEGDPAVEVERIIRRFGLTDAFPEPALAEARAISEFVRAEEIAGRRDLRGEPIVTIDGETAKDFDDAVAVYGEPGGVLRLVVSIADVAHYVRAGAPLDDEARRRGTSVYFPNRVIPMLPERLSNGICSLNPGVDRLTLTAELAIDPSGKIVSTDFYESVIRSAARLTYTKVAAVLRGDAVPEIEHLRPQIMLMGEMMTRLRRARRRRGSIDFDLPEPEVMIDMTTGEPDAIIRSVRNDAHRLIEEMMIAANEAVARWFEGRRLPTIYRVHAPPDPAKLENFALVARAFGFRPPATEHVLPLALADFLDTIEGKPSAHAINTLLLRSMMRAEYREENIGHYGLASDAYLHFTSPIRRYPDLIVHRLLKAHLAKRGSALPDASALAEIARSSSDTERTADLAEYAVVDYWRARFMLDKVGEEYEGIVSGVAEFGVFVELIDFFVEGLIRVAELSSDYFILTDTGHALVGRKSGLAFTIGDRARVVVESVNLSEGRVEFGLIQKHSR
jgi:ribonuclease R